MRSIATACVLWCLLGGCCWAQGILITDLDQEIRPNGEDHTERIRIALASDKVRNRKVIFPAGTYKISGPIVGMSPGNKCSLVGEGISRTRFLLTADVKEPIFSLTGLEAYQDPFEHLSWITIDEIEFDGGDHKAVWFDLKFVAHLYFHRCLWRNTPSTVFLGKSWWDTTFTECHFAKVGSATDPVIALTGAPTGEKLKQHWCNNIVFENNRFEQIPGTAIALGRAARKNRFISCKFDRVGAAFDDGGEMNISLGCQYTKTKSPLSDSIHRNKAPASAYILD